MSDSNSTYADSFVPPPLHSVFVPPDQFDAIEEEKPEELEAMKSPINGTSSSFSPHAQGNTTKSSTKVAPIDPFLVTQPVVSSHSPLNELDTTLERQPTTIATESPVIQASTRISPSLSSSPGSPEPSAISLETLSAPEDDTPVDLSQMVIIHDGITFSLANPCILIGRNDLCDLRLRRDPQVSGRHCRIVGGTLEDNNSTNGTFLNGVRVEPGKAVTLSVGDVINCGATALTVSRLPTSSSSANASNSIPTHTNVNVNLGSMSTTNTSLLSSSSEGMLLAAAPGLRASATQLLQDAAGSSLNAATLAGLGGLASMGSLGGPTKRYNPVQFTRIRNEYVQQMAHKALHSPPGLLGDGSGITSTGGQEISEEDDLMIMPRMGIASLEQLLEAIGPDKNARAVMTQVYEELMVTRRRESMLRRKKNDRKSVGGSAYADESKRQVEELQKEVAGLKFNLLYGDGVSAKSKSESACPRCNANTDTNADADTNSSGVGAELDNKATSDANGSADIHKVIAAEEEKTTADDTTSTSTSTSTSAFTTTSTGTGVESVDSSTGTGTSILLSQLREQVQELTEQLAEARYQLSCNEEAAATTQQSLTVAHAATASAEERARAFAEEARVATARIVQLEEEIASLTRQVAALHESSVAANEEERVLCEQLRQMSRERDDAMESYARESKSRVEAENLLQLERDEREREREEREKEREKEKDERERLATEKEAVEQELSIATTATATATTTSDDATGNVVVGGSAVCAKCAEYAENERVHEALLKQEREERERALKEREEEAEKRKHVEEEREEKERECVRVNAELIQERLDRARESEEREKEMEERQVKEREREEERERMAKDRVDNDGMREEVEREREEKRQLCEQIKEVEEEKIKVEKEREKVEGEKDIAEKERKKAEEARDKVEEEKKKVEEERKKIEEELVLVKTEQEQLQRLLREKETSVRVCAVCEARKQEIEVQATTKTNAKDEQKAEVEVGGKKKEENEEEKSCKRCSEREEKENQATSPSVLSSAHAVAMTADTHTDDHRDTRTKNTMKQQPHLVTTKNNEDMEESRKRDKKNQDMTLMGLVAMFAGIFASGITYYLARG